MKDFKRIFAYILPQWPRLIIVVLTAMIIAMLLSISFVTIAPLLKIMIADEGLHGWVDSKACHWQWGIEFWTPEKTDYLQADNPVPYKWLPKY